MRGPALPSALLRTLHWVVAVVFIVLLLLLAQTMLWTDLGPGLLPEIEPRLAEESARTLQP
jgi:hypothetical protein